jgi:GTP-binding protein
VYRAERGQHGKGALKTGASGADSLLEVPAGTTVRDAATDELLGDLTHPGDTLVVVRGGRGGRGNAAYKTATNQAPRAWEPGFPGEEREIDLELKLLADVGLVGLPNAGKSTLISVISAARPKIADYPFTTLVPNLGIARVDEGKSFVVADIPGLIDGAHQGKGLGIQFLRHIERTKVLCLLIDATGEDMDADLDVLLRELKLFNPELLRKKRIVALTKADAVPGGPASLRRKKFGRTPVYVISAVAGSGIPELTKALWDAVSGEKGRKKR